MTGAFSRDYLEAREQNSRAMAEKAADEEVQRLHLELAEAYAALLEALHGKADRAA